MEVDVFRIKIRAKVNRSVYILVSSTRGKEGIFEAGKAGMWEWHDLKRYVSTSHKKPEGTKAWMEKGQKALTVTALLNK